MITDPEQYVNPSGLFDELIISSIGSEKGIETVVEYCEDLLIDEVTELKLGSRSPKLYLFGRSGAGKSSLINALADKQVAETNAFEPTTVSSEAYKIAFPNSNAEWEVIDSRGLFESAPPDGGFPIETVEKLESDLITHNPDILLHVMTPEQVRAGEDDFDTFERLNDSMIGGLPPRIMCINKVDTYLSLGGNWPPERNQELKKDIIDTMNLVTDILPVFNHYEFEDSNPIYGRIFESNSIIGVFPMYIKEKPYWNFDTILELLHDYLPNNGLLQFARAQRRERLMRQISRKQTIAIANTINQIPHKLIINPSVPIVTGFESYLIALIGAFSGREFNGDTVNEFLDAGGESFGSVLSTVSGITSDSLTGIFKSDVPNIRNNIYVVGRSAETYFFDGEIVEESDFLPEAKEYFTQH